jgi:hypothetical protein
MSLDLRKKKVELLRVNAAKAELDLRVYERLDEIERIKAHIKVQEDAETKLKEEILNLEKK